MYTDKTPAEPASYDNEMWTVAVVRNDKGYQEVHFGLFTLRDAREAMESGMVRVMDDEHLELRRIREFPKKKR
jgi:hypothetical protein